MDNNKHCLVNGKTFHWQKLVGKADQIKHWITNEGRCKTYQEMKTLVRNITIMEYNQIMVAIPKEWKQAIKHKKETSLMQEAEKVMSSENER